MKFVAVAFLALATAAGTTAAPSVRPEPPAHSIAVLPFLNMDDDHRQGYFSDGLSEELLNSLSRIAALQVVARTSSFSFKRRQVTVVEVGRQLNVASVLEGSVRRSGNKVHITAQLSDAGNGNALWAKTYDREFKDVIALPAEIAESVAMALKVRLPEDERAVLGLGGTRNPEAFDAYLRAFAITGGDRESNDRSMLAALDQAILDDPDYALAQSHRAVLILDIATHWLPDRVAIQREVEEARSGAEKAIALAPKLGYAHAVLAEILNAGYLDFAGAMAEFDRALALDPGNAQVLRDYAAFAVAMGRRDQAVAAAQRSIVLDPMNADSQDTLARVMYYARRYPEALAAARRAQAMKPHFKDYFTLAGFIDLAQGMPERAITSCPADPDWFPLTCLAIANHKLNDTSRAEHMLARLREISGDASLYQQAQIYSQWGATNRALEALERAHQYRDPALEALKADPMLDPLRSEQKFDAVLQVLKFPR